MAAQIDHETCMGCGTCESNCPGDVIHTDPAIGKPEVRYPQECWYCGSCRLDCPTDSVKIVFPLTSM